MIEYAIGNEISSFFASDSDNHFTKFGSKVETKPRPFLRRELVNGFCFLAGFGSICDRVNAESRIVRLRDVDNQKLQDALRAAVAGDLEYAESLFSELITQDANSSSVWSNRGSVRLSMGKYEEAKNDFTKAIELAPLAPNPFLNRAIVYEVLGKYPEAVADCKSAIVNDPEEYAAWYNLGNINVMMQSYNDALLAYERASILAPRIAGYRLKQALVLFQLERMEEAKKLIQGLVRKYPNYLEAHAALAAILWSAGDRSRAEEQFTEASLGEPNYKDVRWVRTELQWPPGVVQALENFLTLTLEYAAWYNLGNINVMMQSYNDALLAYERASILAPGIAGYRLKQALVLFQLERMEEAKKLIQGLVRKYPNYLEAHAALAAILWSAGDRSRAEEQFTEASLGEPNYKDVRWVRTELQWPPGVVQALENFLTLTLVN